MNAQKFSILGATCKWTGRALSLLLLAYWGACFVAHTQEWFLRYDGRYPPLLVWRQQTFQFLMILGLAIMLGWDRLGTALLAVSTIGFFALIPGWRWHGRGWFVPVVNLVPVTFFAIYWWTRAAMSPQEGVA